MAAWTLEPEMTSMHPFYSHDVMAGGAGTAGSIWDQPPPAGPPSFVPPKSFEQKPPMAPNWTAAPPPMHPGTPAHAGWGMQPPPSAPGFSHPQAPGGGMKPQWGDTTPTQSWHGPSGPPHMNQPSNWGPPAQPPPPHGLTSQPGTGWGAPTASNQWNIQSPGHQNAKGANSSWAGVVTKGVNPNVPGMHGGLAASAAMPPTGPSAKPMNRYGPHGADNATNWGKKVVDQSTPWEVEKGNEEMQWNNRNAVMHAQNMSHHQPENMWHTGGPSAPTHNDWRPPQPPENPDMYWQPPQKTENDWRVGQSATNNRGPPNMLWSSQTDPMQMNQSNPRPANMWENPQPPAPNNVWTPPQPPKNSMVWEDPSATVRRPVAPDKGTGIWGDPVTQGEIKRWKNNVDEPKSAWAGTPAEQPMPLASVSGSTSSWPETPGTATNGSNGWGAADAKPTIGAGSWMESQSGVSHSAANATIWDMSAQKSNSASTGTASSGLSSHVTKSGSWDRNFKYQDFDGIQSPGSGDADNVFNSPTMPPTTSAGNANLRNGQWPNASGGAPSLTPGQMQNLSSKISEQLRIAVKAGWIPENLLHNPLPEHIVLILNQLLQTANKLMYARQEYQQLQPGQEQERAKLDSNIRRYVADIMSLKETIRTSQPAIPESDGTASGATVQQSAEQVAIAHSKLQTAWRNNGIESTSPVSSGSNSLKNGSLTTPIISNLSAMSLDSNADGSTKSSEDDSTKMMLQQGTSAADADRMERFSPDSKVHSSTAQPSVLSDGPLPPEFKPGQPWHYKGKEVDDNTTPAELQSRKTLSLAEFNFDPEARLSVGNSAFGTQTNTTPTKLDTRVSGLTTNSWNSPLTGINQNAGIQRPSSVLGQPRMPPMNSSAANGGTGASMRSGIGGGSAFQPFNNLASSMNPNWSQSTQTAQWIVLMNPGTGQQIDEGTLKMLCQRHGQIQTFIFPPGAHFAVVKFKEEGLDKILPRMQQELAFHGVTVQMAKNPEIERLLQAASTMRGQPVPSINTAPPMAPPGHVAGGWGMPPTAAADPMSSWNMQSAFMPQLNGPPLDFGSGFGGPDSGHLGDANSGLMNSQQF